MTRFTLSPDGWDEETIWAMETVGPIAVLQARDLGHAFKYWAEIAALITAPDPIDQAINAEHKRRDAYIHQQSGVRG